MNPFSYLFLICLLGGITLECLLSRRHIRHVRARRERVPEDFAGKIPLPAHQKAADYTQAKVRLNVVASIAGGVLALLWTFGGGLELLDDIARASGLGTLATGTLFLLMAIAIMQLLDLPLTIYRAFRLEQSFGFNKMTARIMLADLTKNAGLGLLVGTPLLVLVLWLMAHSGALWWLWTWVVWLCFSLLMLWVYPALIAPLFNKFRPLENPELEKRIVELLTRNGFSSQGVFVMDGSARSTHGNAYFTGLGSNKRIVFFDTLIDELDHDEIEAVLAHELGHFKCRHIATRMIVMSTLTLAALAVLGLLIDASWFYHGLGVSRPSDHQALALLVLVAPAFVGFLQPLLARLSRQHEFEADDFAAAQAHSSHLISALVKLYRENANTLTPDPLYSAFHDSHPPAAVRIARLQAARQT